MNQDRLERALRDIGIRVETPRPEDLGGGITLALDEANSLKLIELAESLLDHQGVFL